MAPILPGVSDRPEQLAEVVKAPRAAGATGIWANLLYLAPGTKEHFLDALSRDWPEQLGRYEELYAKGAYLPAPRSSPCGSRCASSRASTGSGIAGARSSRRRPEPEQLTLGV